MSDEAIAKCTKQIIDIEVPREAASHDPRFQVTGITMGTKIKQAANTGINHIPRGSTLVRGMVDTPKETRSIKSILKRTRNEAKLSLAVIGIVPTVSTSNTIREDTDHDLDPQHAMFVESIPAETERREE